jgi:uncharacterized protein YjbJ (UPF0337 family)
MNEDILKGEWKQLKGRVRQRWAKLTDDDLSAIKGDRDVLMGKIQEYYGRSREQAEDDLDRWIEAERISTASTKP